MHHHAPIEALSVEILEHILLMIQDPLTVYRCRQVSQGFRSTIDESPRIKHDVLFLEPNYSTPAINLPPHFDEDCRCLPGPRRPAAAICNNIIISSPPNVRCRCTVPADMTSCLVFAFESTLRPLRYPLSLERLGLNGSTLSDLAWPSKLNAMNDFPFFDMQLSSPPCQTVVVWGRHKAHFRLDNPAGVRYSDVVSQARSYARKELEGLHRRPGTRLKKRLTEERKIYVEKELICLQVYIMDVAALDSKCGSSSCRR